MPHKKLVDLRMMVAAQEARATLLPWADSAQST